MLRSRANIRIHSLVVVGFSYLAVGLASAQSYKVLHWLSPNEGAYPNTLILSSNTLYGTANSGGNAGKGTVFALNIDGTGFTVLHSFGGYADDGSNPSSKLTLANNTLYGTTIYGGSSGNGSVFRLSVDGTDFTNLYFFSAGNVTNSDGAYPIGALVLSGDRLFGTASHSGSSSNGTVFALGLDGTGFTNLHTFTGSDGGAPTELVTSGNTLYGIASNGGSNGYGVVFCLKMDGTAFTNLHSFSHADGAFPSGNLVLSTDTLYGTTSSGGSWSNGTIFSVKIDGTAFTTLHDFTTTSSLVGNSDGANPKGGLVLWKNALYGTAQFGGASRQGTVFAVNKDGTDFTTLHMFTGSVFTTNYGLQPLTGVVLSGNTLYGTDRFGGVFSITMDIQLSIIPNDGGAILTWPRIPSGFSLQSTTNVLSPVWRTVSSAPAVVGGQNIVLNPISGTQQFFRLSQ